MKNRQKVCPKFYFKQSIRYVSDRRFSFTLNVLLVDDVISGYLEVSQPLPIAYLTPVDVYGLAPTTQQHRGR